MNLDQAISNWFELFFQFCKFGDDVVPYYFSIEDDENYYLKIIGDRPFNQKKDYNIQYEKILFNRFTNVFGEDVELFQKTLKNFISDKYNIRIYSVYQTPGVIKIPSIR